ncbi:MAG: hypothetical protein KDI55_15615 [Anaerolineae bacterium]|nr:hypothetical protein [Anaerolineae bacterium]
MGELLMTEPDELQFDPIDWQQMQIFSSLTIGERMKAMAQVSAFNHGLLRGAFRRRYPDLPIEEINMLMLRYLEWMKEKGL